MAALVLDCETSGLWRKDLQLGDVGQPWVVKLAAGHFGNDAALINAFDLTVRPNGRRIKEAAEKVHGISAIDAERVGISESFVLLTLADMAGKVGRVVTFGDFDPMVIEHLLVQLEQKTNQRKYVCRWRRPGLEFVNIQHPACQLVCNLPPAFEGGDPAWPSLDVACEVILGIPPREGHHQPWEDLRRTNLLYRELLRRGHFEGEAA
ncbi:hypothetical protein [Pleomorphomonas sp. PLEO]|uniref:hypothetical protein n=1 Tax=Pleomorphomonas sp. PLEO TaxID=3239306 RepID=UPI00351E2434